MRVVCPHNPAGNPNNPFSAGALKLTVAALREHAPDFVLVDLGVEHDAYFRLLRDLWEAGESFLIVEQDVEIHELVVPSLTACDGEWCVHPYGGPGHKPDVPLLMERALGCTRFSASLLERMPGFMAQLPVRDWRRLDCEISPRLLEAGVRWCRHPRPVAHHHVYAGHGCACGGSHEEVA